MTDCFEIDFLGVETKKSGDAITLRYGNEEIKTVHVVDGGYIDTGDQIIEHLRRYYNTDTIDHVILTHPDRDHANGLRKVLEECQVRNLWINRPWLYAKQLLPRFKNYNSEDALYHKLRSIYDATAALEDLAKEKGIPIHSPLQGCNIGRFAVTAPSLDRYLTLVVESSRTPEPATESLLEGVVADAIGFVKAAANLVKSAWGDEYFPPGPTSRENEMSVVQTGVFDGKRILLTGDAGREALSEVISYAPQIGMLLPGSIRYFQVPHHGGRHNISTNIMNKLFGKPLSSLPEKHTWNAVCSSAKEDEDHPRKSVIRAVLHRGGHWAETEGKTVHIGVNMTREGWVKIAQVPYPEEQEE